MNRNSVTWMAGAIPVLGVGAGSVILGMTLVPSRMAVQEAGTLVPWLLTWGLIGTTVLMVIVLATFLIRIGGSK